MRIQCPACFIEIEAPHARVGDEGQCAICGAGFIVPEGSRDRVEMITPEKLPSGEIDCPVCSTSVKISAENLGKKGRCERCDSKFIIPRNDGDKAKILERGRLPISELNCPVCSTVVRVSWVNLGKKGRCEDCHSKFIVPENPDDEIEIIEQGVAFHQPVDDRLPEEMQSSQAEQ